ncbi:ankyrin [Clavulina sp. PMI_390]|nr:ankyrin [Clavulina sp. PMI_390]
MSTPPHTGASPSQIAEIWSQAIVTFESTSKRKLQDSALLKALEDAESIADIEAALNQCGSDLKTFRKKGQSVRAVLKPVLSCLKLLVEPVGEVASDIGVPGGKAIFAAFARLLQAIDGVSRIYDKLTRVLDNLHEVLSRMGILNTANAITPALQTLHVKTLAQALVILGFFIRYCDTVRKRSVWDAWFTRGGDFVSSLFGSSELAYENTKLGTLCEQIQLTTTAEILATATSAKLGVKFLEISERRKEDKKWLSAPNPYINQEERLEQGSRVPDHANWFLELSSFTEWCNHPAGFYWVSADAGVGKSVLCSRVVQYVKQKAVETLSPCAFFYFDYRDKEKRTFKKFLASIVNHFMDTSTACDEVILRFKKETDYAFENELIILLNSMFDTPGLKYLIIDSIDECLEEERAKLLPFLRDLAYKGAECQWNLHIFATSRPTRDITDIMAPPEDTEEKFVTHQTLLGDSHQHRVALEAFIDIELKDPRPGWSEDDRLYVRNELLKRSNSMFLWVKLQLKELERCSGDEALQLVSEMPSSLSETYARILGSIPKIRWKTVRAVLECLIAAPQPLSVQEIEEIRCLKLDDLDDHSACASLELKKGASVKGNGLGILDFIPGLLKTETPEHCPTRTEVHFIHFTVQEYLLSLPDIREKRPQNHEMALNPRIDTAFGTSRKRAASTLLMVITSAYEPNNYPTFPELRSQAMMWWYHLSKSILAEGGHTLIAPTLDRFLHPKSSTFHLWINERSKELGLDSKALDHPLHWAVRIGSTSHVKRLLDLEADQNRSFEGDVRNKLDSLGWSPVCYAACSGDTAVLRILLEQNDSWTKQKFGFRELSIVHLILPGDPRDYLPNQWWAADSAETSYVMWPVPHNWKMQSYCPQVLQILGEAAKNQSKLMNTPSLDYDSPFSQIISEELFWDSGTPFEMPYMKTVEVLLRYGVDVNTRSRNNGTILHRLVDFDGLHETISFIQRLVQEYGADLNAADDNDATPLKKAILMGSLEYVKGLLDLGAELHLLDSAGRGPLDWILRSSQLFAGATDKAERDALPNMKKMFLLLQEHGAKLHSAATAPQSVEDKVRQIRAIYRANNPDLSSNLWWYESDGSDDEIEP